MLAWDCMRILGTLFGSLVLYCVFLLPPAHAEVEYCYTFTLPGGNPQEQCVSTAQTCEAARQAVEGAATSISGSCYQKGENDNQCLDNESGYICVEEARCGSPVGLAGCGVGSVCCDWEDNPDPDSEPDEDQDPAPDDDSTPDADADPAPDDDSAPDADLDSTPDDESAPDDDRDSVHEESLPPLPAPPVQEDSGGLVSCGNNIVVQYGTNSAGKAVYRYVGECTVCDFQETLMNILDFLVATMVAVAALLFVNAGFFYLTAQGNASKVSKAHKLFVNTLIGLVLVLAAYMLVDVLMKTLVADEGNISEAGPWNSILCLNSTDWYEVDQLGQTTLRAEEYTLHAIGPGWNPVTDVAYDSTTGVSVLTVDAKNAGYQNLTNNCSVGGVSCVDYITTQALNYGVNPNYATALAVIESGGCADPASCGSGAGAVGVIQLLPGTAREMCGSACVGMSDLEMNQQLKDPRKNIEWGVKYMAQSESYVEQQMQAHPERFESGRQNDYMAAYYNGGPGALEASNDCGPTKTKYECHINPGGYIETQKYVANMNKITSWPLNPTSYTTGGGF